MCRMRSIQALAKPVSFEESEGKQQNYGGRGKGVLGIVYLVPEKWVSMDGVLVTPRLIPTTSTKCFVNQKQFERRHHCGPPWSGSIRGSTRAPANTPLRERGQLIGPRVGIKQEVQLGRLSNLERILRFFARRKPALISCKQHPQGNSHHKDQGQPLHTPRRDTVHAR